MTSRCPAQEPKETSEGRFPSKITVSETTSFPHSPDLSSAVGSTNHTVLETCVCASVQRLQQQPKWIQITAQRFLTARN
jgi:hypothetical protein